MSPREDIYTRRAYTRGTTRKGESGGGRAEAPPLPLLHADQQVSQELRLCSRLSLRCGGGLLFEAGATVVSVSMTFVDEVGGAVEVHDAVHLDMKSVRNLNMQFDFDLEHLGVSAA